MVRPSGRRGGSRARAWRAVLLRCAVLLSAVLVGACAAHAEDGHDHGKPAARAGAGGPVREVALPEGLSSAQSLALDSAGRVWIAEKVGRRLAVYDPEKKAFTVHALPDSWGNMGFSSITAGADDAIWFTVSRWAEGSEEPRLLGRFTPADGYFTKFALSNDAVPRELMVDAKGAIWFLAANRNSLYRVDPATFALKGYPIPFSKGHARSLAAEPGGRIWFVEANANRIVAFDPTREAFEAFEVPTAFSGPGRLSVDARGRVWFVEVAANRLGMFSPDKKRFDEAIVPTPGSAPVALVNDAQGNVWFLEHAGNKVGVFNPETAAFREYDIPTYGSLPGEIVLDRKRSLLWFTESATEAKRLGMLSIAEASAASSETAKPASGEARSGWLVALVASLGAASALGGWLAVRSRRKRRS